MFTYLRKTADINQLTNGQNGREFIGQRDKISVLIKGRGRSGLLYKKFVHLFQSNYCARKGKEIHQDVA